MVADGLLLAQMYKLMGGIGESKLGISVDSYNFLTISPFSSKVHLISKAPRKSLSHPG
jgi:hypothetical protein